MEKLYLKSKIEIFEIINNNDNDDNDDNDIKIIDHKNISSKKIKLIRETIKQDLKDYLESNNFNFSIRISHIDENGFFVIKLINNTDEKIIKYCEEEIIEIIDFCIISTYNNYHHLPKNCPRYTFSIEKVKSYLLKELNN